LIAGLIAREGAWAATDLIEKGFVLACRVACSPVVATTRAGWSNQSRPFEAVLANVPIERAFAKFVLTKLLDLPIPADADESLVAAWPDPFRLLVTAWYVRATVAGAAPRTELRKLGEKIAGGARPALASNPQLRSALEESRRSLRSIETADGSQRRLIITRRLTLLDNVLSQRAPVKAGRK
jgi:hypothetical protein